MEVFGVPNSSNYTFENTLNVYPNPASEMVTFVINNTIDDNYTLTLNDMYGRVVKLLINNQLLPAGTQTRSFNIADLSKGMYTYRLSSASFTRKGLFTKQ
jgi:DNA/RNA endonuclease YhcR with UshA esterase domain